MKFDVLIFEYGTYQEFLKDVVAENIKKKGKEFGYRHLSGTLGWPPTYLNDLVNKRKKLSVTKSWELALSFELNTLEKDYLTFLVLKEASNKTLKAHAEKSLRDWKNIQTFQVQNPNMSFHYNILVPFLRGLIGTMPEGSRTEKKILEKIHATPIGPQFATEDVLFTLRVMVEMKLLSISGGVYHINHHENPIFFGEDAKDPNSPFRMRRLFQQYALCWESFLENRKDENFHLKSSFVLMNMDQMRMVAKKIDELRDLCYNFDTENARKSKKNQKLHLVQYNFNFLDITHSEKNSVKGS